MTRYSLALIVAFATAIGATVSPSIAVAQATDVGSDGEALSDP
jgi:hypothetical protein